MKSSTLIQSGAISSCGACHTLKPIRTVSEEKPSVQSRSQQPSNVAEVLVRLFSCQVTSVTVVEELPLNGIS